MHNSIAARFAIFGTVKNRRPSNLRTKTEIPAPPRDARLDIRTCRATDRAPRPVARAARRARNRPATTTVRTRPNRADRTQIGRAHV